MASIDQFSIPECVRRELKQDGYVPDSSMSGLIEEWWEWYTCARDDFYKVPYTTTGGRKRKRPRWTLHPARRVCREWASLLLNEDTGISVEAPKANEWLQSWLDSSEFWLSGQGLVERAFALGTGAWALWFDVGEDGAAVKARAYDARMTVPLSWDVDGVTECAFVTRATVGGKRVHQLQEHVLDAGRYVIRTKVFDNEGHRIDAASLGVIDELPTYSAFPTFGIVRPAIENVRADCSPYGQSVFADAVDAVQAVDLAWDSIFQEVKLTGAMVFMDDALIDVRDGESGKTPVPRGDGDQVFRMVNGNGIQSFYEVYSPEIRVAPLKESLQVALAELGDQCGFGQDYFKLDKHGGIRTATEVSSDNSALMRSIHKHEVVLRGAIQGIVSGLLACARTVCGEAVEEDFGAVSVAFDDSIITDTATDKAQLLAEIAAGVADKWEYRERFYGEDEETARANVPAAPEPEPFVGF